MRRDWNTRWGQAWTVGGEPTRRRRFWWSLVAALSLAALALSWLALSRTPDGAGMVSDDDEAAQAAEEAADRALDEFEQRCLGPTSSFEPAQVSFNDTPTMRLDETAEVTLAIGPRGQDIDGLRRQDEVMVTCSIDARFVVSANDAAASPADWETRRYVPPLPAEWSWLVTPLRAGEIDARIEIRPLLVVATDGGSRTTEYVTRSYELDLMVAQSLLDRLNALTAQVKAVLGLVTAMTALAVALGVKRWGPALWARLRPRPRSSEDTAQRESGYL